MKGFMSTYQADRATNANQLTTKERRRYENYETSASMIQFPTKQSSDKLDGIVIKYI
jgi:hypothetical protein